MKKNFKLAFTMAEAILVMTILGIIATIMISTLKPAQFKDKALLTMAKKVMSEVDQATTQIMINNTSDGTFATVEGSCNTDNPTCIGNHGNIFNDFWMAPAGASVLSGLYAKYLTVIRSNVYPAEALTNFLALEVETYGPEMAVENGAMTLKDGAWVIVWTGAGTFPTVLPGESSTTDRAGEGFIYFDTNGKKEPNAWGKDQFLVTIDEHGIMYDD